MKDFRDLKKRILRCGFAAVMVVVISLVSFYGQKSFQSLHHGFYMIYYGALDDDIIEKAKQYEIVIVHPGFGNITRAQVQEIQAGGTMVFGYISVGEDLRTAGMTPEQMLEDERFTGNGTGPRTKVHSTKSSDENDIVLGEASKGGTGYASYYLDDNDLDGRPDFNRNSARAYTNIGDPEWFDTLDLMTIDGEDQMSGIRETLSDDYGRGLCCDGILIDNIDTCAPHSFTDEDSPNKMRFEWTASGAIDFMKRLKEKYPDKLIVQNGGKFFYNPQLSHYTYNPREYVDFLMVEGYMLDSGTEEAYNEAFFADNKYNYTPKLRAEAGRPDGFRILSLGYAEGPEEFELQETLRGKSLAGMDLLMEDIKQAEDEAGFSHYITDVDRTIANDFVITHKDETDDLPPVWSSVYNTSSTWPIGEPEARVGIGQVEPVENGILVRWDVAIDKNDVSYTLYYQKEPFDFEKDPNLKKAESVELVPDVGEGYGNGNVSAYPYQAVVKGMDGGDRYYFVIRAKDNSSNQNEEKNKVVKTGIPLKIPSYMIYYGELNDDIIETLKQYEVVILHPKGGNITREQIQRIRVGGTYVLGYISIGEDLRTEGLTPEQMQADERFCGDGSGPRVDPRSSDSVGFEGIDLSGKESPGGKGYASYYLDDNNLDGKPDMNVNFNCAFTNIGDPLWYDELNNMTIDGTDHIPGIKEILTYDYGRGLGCDGLFLDTIDTCLPNASTADGEPGKTRFEWTAPGVVSFMKRLKEEYPDKLILQNRGLFFYDPESPYYPYNPREYVDYLFFESYMLNSNPNELYYNPFFLENKYVFMPKLSVEASRKDGFRILSLGYAEGPEELELRETLLGKSDKGMDTLMEDLDEARNEAGFSHYITDKTMTLVNDFVAAHGEMKDDQPPTWRSVCNNADIQQTQKWITRVGIGETEAIVNGMIVRWDVATDKNDVTYTLYYQKEPFNFKKDPNLRNAQSMELIPEIGEGYGESGRSDAYPYQAVVKGLDAEEEYYFIIRARDNSDNKNEEKNTEIKTGVPLLKPVS